jgi:hypothetical protein
MKLILPMITIGLLFSIYQCGEPSEKSNEEKEAKQDQTAIDSLTPAIDENTNFTFFITQFNGGGEEIVDSLGKEFIPKYNTYNEYTYGVVERRTDQYVVVSYDYAHDDLHMIDITYWASYDLLGNRISELEYSVNKDMEWINSRGNNQRFNTEYIETISENPLKMKFRTISQEYNFKDAPDSTAVVDTTFAFYTLTTEGKFEELEN